MKMEVHNQLDLSYKKTTDTISFFAKSSLNKFCKKRNWKLEVWLDEKNSLNSPRIRCGVALVRPNKNTVYAKKTGSSLNEAVKESLSTLEHFVRKENKGRLKYWAM